MNRAILSSLNAGVAILDRNGAIIRTSDNWAAQVRPAGSHPPATIGDDCLEMWRDWSQASDCTHSITAAIEGVLSGQQMLRSIECHMQLPQEDHWIEVRVEKLVRREGGAVITHMDITPRKRAELDRRRTLEELHHLNRVVTAGELAASLAHELAQPLASILSNAQAATRFAARERPDIVEIREALREIAEDDHRACTIIERLRMILRKQVIRTEELDLNMVVIDVSRLVRSVLQIRGVRMDLELAHSRAPVEGDPVLLQQVLLNLIQNGMDAVQIQPRGLRRLTVRTSLHSGSVEMVVEDNGAGVPDEIRERLFDSFFTTKQSGLGMGLSICRSIVEGMGGQIVAGNRQAGGASFQVSLPLAGASKAADPCRMPAGRPSAALVLDAIDERATPVRNT